MANLTNAVFPLFYLFRSLVYFDILSPPSFPNDQKTHVQKHQTKKNSDKSAARYIGIIQTKHIPKYLPVDVNRGIFALQLSLGNLLVRGVLKQSCFAIQRYFKQAAKNENAYE